MRSGQFLLVPTIHFSRSHVIRRAFAIKFIIFSIQSFVLIIVKRPEYFL